MEHMPQSPTSNPQTTDTRPPRASWGLSLLITLVVCLISYFAAKQLLPPEKTDLRSAVELPVYAGQPCVPFRDGAIYYDGTILYALRGTGMQRWSYLAGANAGFHAEEAGVVSWTGAQVTLLQPDSGDTVFSVTMPDNVLTARAGTVYVAVLTGQEDDAQVVLLDRNGRQADLVDTPDVTVVDMGFFNNGSLFWLMTLETDGTVPTSRIATYKPGKMQTGIITDADQVVYRVLFHATRIRAVGTTYSRAYDYTGAEDSPARKLVYGWYLQDVYGSGEDPLMAFVPMDETGGSQAMQDVRIVQGSHDKTMRMPYPCQRILAGNQCVYGFTGEFVQVASLREEGTRIYRLPVYCEGVIGLTADSKALIVSDGKVYLVALP